ncbi:hypothetical protein NMY22_g14153 [Coprinellus aureogranulatus]|nr:hypothetical protein NMY22_g14153 [Coprinellus aureogranulatus]
MLGRRSVSELPTVGEAMDVLRDAHLALILIFCAGWVHRDVSASNILADKKGIDAPWHARLVDLEHTRRFPSGDPDSASLKTGTLYFVSCEIESSINFYSIRASPKDRFGYSGWDDDSDPLPKEVRKHTYAHDLESLWWLILWIVTNRVNHARSHRKAYRYFQGNNIMQRRKLLEYGPLPVLHPVLGGVFLKRLDSVRRVIFLGYEGRNPHTDLEDLKTYRGSCGVFVRFFDTIDEEEVRAVWGQCYFTQFPLWVSRLLRLFLTGLCHPVPPNRSRGSDESHRGAAEAATHLTQYLQRQCHKKHTYSHDIESLWWFILWILTKHVGHAKSYRAAYNYFQRKSVGKRRVLLRNAVKEKIVIWSADLPILHPDLRVFIPWLSGVRAVLFRRYKRRHPETEINNLRTYKGLCAAFAHMFDAVNKEEKRATWDSETVKLHPLNPVLDTPLPSPIKNALGSPGGAAARVQVGMRHGHSEMETAEGSSTKGSLAGQVPKPNPPHTPKGPARSAQASEPGSFTPRREREQAADDPQTRLRRMIVERMKNETVYCADDDFIEHYLPPIPDAVNLETVLTNLGDHLQKSTQDKDKLLGEFSKRPMDIKNQKGKSTNEKAIFAPLGNVAKAIRDTIGAATNEFHLRMVPDTELSSEIPGCTFKIDACTTATQKAPGTLHVTDIVVPFEFKIQNTEDKKQENRAQIVSTIVHIMNDDVRRNFIYAITIENDHVSLWYFSRTHSVKATSFSYVKDPEKLVRVLVSLSCASKEQLGYDPRITLLDDKSYLYEFPASDGPLAASGADATEALAVAPSLAVTASSDSTATSQPSVVYFKTIGGLGEARSFHVAGRTTRVYKAQQVISKKNTTPIPGAPEVVVKDVWIDADGLTEVEIQKRLFHDIQAFAAGDWENHPLLEMLPSHTKEEFGEMLAEERYKGLFLRATMENVGCANKAVHPDAWDSDKIFQETTDRNFMRPAHGTAEQEIPSTCRAFSPKKRCFYVFPDVCTRVSALPTLGEAMDVLYETHIALLFMFCAGWIHRDISSGNVLAVKKDMDASWHAKLADLEYARKFPSDDAGSTDPKTGTPYFMAVEIQSSESFYETKDDRKNDKDRNMKVPAGFLKPQQHQPLQVKKHTYTHDIESLWWLVVWILTNHVGHEASYRAAYRYFQQNDVAKRRVLLKNGDVKAGLPILHRDLSAFCEPLVGVATVLVDDYKHRNPSTDLENLDMYMDACSVFAHFFGAVNRQEHRAVWETMKLYPIFTPPEPAPVQAVVEPAPSSLATQSTSKKRKAEQVQDIGPAEVVPQSQSLRRSTRNKSTTKASAKVDKPGPSKKQRN